MRIANIAAMVLALGLGGCQLGQTPEEKLALELAAKARDQMLDPSSVKFKNVRVNLQNKCMEGEVLAKNGMGNYTGYKTFVFAEEKMYIEPDSDTVYAMIETNDQYHAYSVQSRYCKSQFPAVPDSIFAELGPA